MVNERAVGTWIRTAGLLLLSSATALAADEAAPSTSGGVFRAAWQEGPLVFLVTLLIVLICGGLFIHAAASITKLENRTFWKAIKAAALAWVLALVVAFIVGLVCGVAGVKSQGATAAAVLVCILLPGTLAIRSIYEAGFVTSLVTYVIAGLLTIAVMIGAYFALGATLGTA